MQQKYKLTFPIAAVALTVLFVTMAGHFFPNLYLGVADAEGNLDYFRNELLARGLTPILALITAGIPWLMALLFYYVINSVHFDRWWHWTLVLVITSLTTSYAGWLYLSSRLTAESAELVEYYSPYLLSLSAWDAVIAAVAFIVASVGMRWWSSNCRHTPFPQ